MRGVVMFNVVVKTGGIMETEEFGIVVTTYDGCAQLIGIETVFMGELIIFENVIAVTVNLEEVLTGTLLFGGADSVEEGEFGSRAFTELVVDSGFDILGTVVDPLGNSLLIEDFS